MAQCLHLLETAPFHENGTGRCAQAKHWQQCFYQASKKRGV